MKPLRLWLYGIIVRFLPETRFFDYKASLLRWCGLKVGKRVRVCSSVRILGDGGMEIGDDVWIGPATLIMTCKGAQISIGNHCDIAPQVTILTGSHEIDVEGTENIAGRGVVASTTIGRGCWVGARSVILPGVTLSERTLVGAGAIVTLSINRSNCMIAGVPARLIKQYR